MDYKRKYKEALELARVAAFNGHQSLMEGIFPELAESKDEKTRKRIIALVNAHGQGMYKDDMLAWLENIPYTIDHEKREGFHLGYKAGLEKQGEQSSLNINRECLKGIKRVQEYQDLSDWEKEFDNIASMYAHNKNQEGYNDSWYVKERAAEMLYYAKKELEKQGGQKSIIEMKTPEESLGIDSETYNKIVNECIYGEQASARSEKDREMIDETLYFIREYQQSNRCKDENGMQNSVTCEKWLKSLKERIGGKQ